jgi:HEAT repeat protein
MGEAASPALPCLIEALKDEHTGVYSWVVEAVTKLGPQALEVIPHLKEIVNGSDDYRRQVAAKALKIIEGGAHPGQES